MLHPARAAVSIRPRGDIAQRPDMRGAGTAHRIAHHAVVDLDTRPVQPVRGGPAPDTQHDEIGVQPRAVGQGDGLNPPVALDRVYADSYPNVYALVAMQPGNQVAELLSDRRQQRSGLRFDENHVNSVGTQCGRDLTPDKSGPDHHRSPRLRSVASQREAVIGGTQDVDAVQLGEGSDTPGNEAGRDDGLSVLQGAAIIQRGRPGSRVQRDHLGTESQFNLLLVVKLSRFEHYRIDCLLRVAQDVLGQRRTVVGQVRLAAHDGDRSGELGAA